MVLAGLIGSIRLALPRRLVELQLERFRLDDALVSARRRSLFLAVIAVIWGGVYFIPWGHQGWVAISVFFFLTAGAEAYCQTKLLTLDALIFQTRLFSILYLGVAVACYVIVRRV